MVKLGECDPFDEECLKKYCTHGYYSCIQKRDQTLFEDYLDKLEAEKLEAKELVEEEEIIVCDFPEIEYLN